MPPIDVHSRALWTKPRLETWFSPESDPNSEAKTPGEAHKSLASRRRYLLSGTTRWLGNSGSALARPILGTAPAPRASISACKLAALFQHSEGSGRRWHQETVSARDQALDVASIGVRMSARHVVLFANLENVVDRISHHRMLIVSRVAQLLA